LEELDQADWRLQSFCTPALYDLGRITERPIDMDDATAMALAEKLTGTIRLHKGYAVPKGDDRKPASCANRSLVPHFMGLQASALARAVAQGKALPATLDGVKMSLSLPKEAAPLIAGVNGKRNLQTIAQATGMDTLKFGMLWSAIERTLCGQGLLRYSNLTAKI
jgi:hypothetical protein